MVDQKTSGEYGWLPGAIVSLRASPCRGRKFGDSDDDGDGGSRCIEILFTLDQLACPNAHAAA